MVMLIYFIEIKEFVNFMSQWAEFMFPGQVRWRELFSACHAEQTGITQCQPGSTGIVTDRKPLPS
jgi:hypothetical protein